MESNWAHKQNLKRKIWMVAYYTLSYTYNTLGAYRECQDKQVVDALRHQVVRRVAGRQPDGQGHSLGGTPTAPSSATSLMMRGRAMLKGSSASTPALPTPSPGPQTRSWPRGATRGCLRTEGTDGSCSSLTSARRRTSMSSRRPCARPAGNLWSLGRMIGHWNIFLCFFACLFDP